MARPDCERFEALKVLMKSLKNDFDKEISEWKSSRTELGLEETGEKDRVSTTPSFPCLCLSLYSLTFCSISSLTSVQTTSYSAFQISIIRSSNDE